MRDTDLPVSSDKSGLKLGSPFRQACGVPILDTNFRTCNIHNYTCYRWVMVDHLTERPGHNSEAAINRFDLAYYPPKPVVLLQRGQGFAVEDFQNIAGVRGGNLRLFLRVPNRAPLQEE